MDNKKLKLKEQLALNSPSALRTATDRQSALMQRWQRASPFHLTPPRPLCVHVDVTAT